jgi:signal recognition particle receptor subunit beta
LVGSLSEIPPVTTEAIMTKDGIGRTNASATPDKTTTTVAMDFGRITINDELVVYMFGTPSQAQFRFMWDGLVQSAVGAVIVVDCRRLADSFDVVDYFEVDKRIPYIVALNEFEGRLDYTAEQVRGALEISPEIPIVQMDARDQTSAKSTLVTLIKHAITTNEAMSESGPSPSAKNGGFLLSGRL